MVMEMDNHNFILLLKIGIIKSLHTKGLITKSQMEQAIKLLYKGGKEHST